VTNQDLVELFFLLIYVIVPPLLGAVLLLSILSVTLCALPWLLVDIRMSSAVVVKFDTWQLFSNVVLYRSNNDFKKFFDCAKKMTGQFPRLPTCVSLFSGVPLV